MNLTDKQKAAVAAKGSVVVYAAAGSGKTAVLTKRAVELLKDKQNVTEADRMLIVTFTNAAAAELRTRINEELYAAIVSEPSSHLLRQEMLISAAPICTIDSFCANLLRENFQYAGISPDFKSASNDDARSLASSIIKDMVGEKYVLGDKNFISLANNIGIESDLLTFTEVVLSVYESSRSMPFPERWLESSAEKYSGTDCGLNYWQNAILADVKNKTDRLIAMLDTAVLEISTDLKLSVYSKAFEGSCAMLSRVNELILEQKYDEVIACLENCKVSIRVSKIDESYTEMLEYIKQVRTTVNDELKKISASLKPSSENAEQLKVEAGLVRALVDFIKEFGQRFRAELISKNTLTFDMIEHMAFSLVCERGENGELLPTELGKSLIEKYKYVMVDEYQDTNTLQDAFFNVISDFGKNLFMVGDAKQSIYGFRHANPGNFINYRDTYQEGEQQEHHKKVVLDANFRSRQGICDFCNFLFSLIMKKETSEMDYTLDDTMNPQAEFAPSSEPSVEIHPVFCGELDKSEAAAARIAQFIKAQMAREPFLRDKNGGLRRAKYSDFVILIRSAGVKGGAYMKVLRESGIPVSFSSDEFAQTFEISAVISLLEAIDNPTKDVSLLAALTGPMFCLDLDTIALSRAEHKKGSIYSSLLAAQTKNAAIKEAISTLSRMRRRAFSMTVGEFLRDIYETNCIPEIMSSIGDSERRNQNLSMLLEIADEYDLQEHAGLSGFLRYFSRVCDQKTSKATQGESDSVKIMTIHASKGLQFPICILAECSAPFSKTDAYASVRKHEKAGISINIKDISNYTKTVPISSRVIRNEIEKTTVAEEQRLLYVALTRAEEKLVLMCDGESFYKKLEKYCSELDVCEKEKGKLLDQTILGASCYADWIAMSVLLHTDMQKTGYCLKDYGKKGTFVINDKDYGEIRKAVDNSEAVADIEVANQLIEKFSSKYSHSDAAKTISKTTVSNILANESKEKYGFSKRPQILSPEGLSGAEKGTALHKFMQYSDFSAASDNLENEIARLYEWEFISEAEADSLDRNAIKEFLNSELCKDMKSAAFTLKEQRFILPYTDQNGIQTVIQGAIDCVYEKDGGIVVVDFKTTKLDTAEQFVSAYKSQLDIYSSAVEEIIGMKVVKKYIYSLHLCKTIEV